MEIYTIILLALAVSMDSFSVGLTYGLRKMHIPLYAILIISCCSSISLFVAAIIGTYLGNILSPTSSETIGGSILILLGVWALFQFFRSPHNGQENSTPLKKVKNQLLRFEIKSLGIVIHILKKPMTADLDRSGTINGFEAILLGTALSLDALGAGISASMLNFSPLLLAVVVGIMCACFVTSGLIFGKLVGKTKWSKSLSFLPGVLLILIGLWKI